MKSKADLFISKYRNEIINGNAFLYFAPGRVNLIGDHTDYSGGVVLPAAIQFGTYLIVKFNNEHKISFLSENFEEKLTIKIDKIDRKTFTWIDYPLGVINQMKKIGLKLKGMDMIFYGDIPNGAGLSSSASIEMVTAYALNDLFSQAISVTDLTLLAQKAENEFVGVSCGIMDQFAVGLGKPGRAIYLDCHSLQYQLVDANFKDYQLIVVNSNKQRTLAGSKYNERVGELNQIKEILNTFTSVPYLGMLSEDDFELFHSKIKDENLLKRFRHVVTENARVRAAVSFLEQNNLAEFGKLMFASHHSLSKDYEVSCKELDSLVSISSNTEGVIGARMTGAGFGGCTVNLVKNELADFFKNKIKNEYPKACKIEPSIFDIQLNSAIGRLPVT